MEKSVLITGASGLLGQALTRVFSETGLNIAAQYYTEKPWIHKNIQWVYADFSTIRGIRDFLKENHDILRQCRFLINNYGPITSKPISLLTSEDFYVDFHHNFITAFEITSQLIRQPDSPLQAVVNIGFEFIGEIRPYKKILAYAAAKNALLLMTKSFEQQYPHIRFFTMPMPTLEGAAVQSPSPVRISPEVAARQILNLILELDHPMFSKSEEMI